MPTLVSKKGTTCEGDPDRKCGDDKVERFSELRRIAQLSKSEVYRVRRLGQLCASPWNPGDLSYGKCTAVVRFRANRPISIVSYGFFGPLEVGTHGKYHMDIELMTENYCPIASTTQVTPVVRPSEIFHVNFENPVPILPCTWYHAKFSLMGPPTGQSQKLSFSSPVQCGDLSNVLFRFEMPDSNQLPEIGFILRI